MISALAFAVAAFATARITRLITADYLTAGPRAKLINRLGVDSKISYLITCPWCTSVWVAAGIAPLTHFWWANPWVQLPLIALALSHITGILARFGED